MLNFFEPAGNTFSCLKLSWLIRAAGVYSAAADVFVAFIRKPFNHNFNN